MAALLGSRTYKVTTRNMESVVPCDTQNLILCWCHDVIMENITSPQLSLTRLEFRGYTSFCNIKDLLEICVNLEVLEFATIGFSNYPGAESLNNLKLTNLKELRVKGNGPLTRYELQIFEYFTEKVTFGSVTTVILNEGAGFQAPGENNNFSQYLHPSALIGWLIQVSSTLKRLEIRRSGIILVPHEDEEVARLQLEAFIFRSNNVGFLHVLSVQLNLKTLGYLKTVGMRPSKSQLVMDFVERRGYRTLEEIIFEHKVLHTLDDMRLRNLSDCEAHDCRIYLECNRLKKLSIESSLLEDPDRRHRSPGTIKNISFLPASLVHLDVKVDHLSDREEMACLQLVLSKMVNLEEFQLRGNMQSPFPVQISLIELLVGLKKLVRFELKFCLIEDFPRLLEYIQTRPQFKSVILLAPNSVCCRRALD